MQICSFLRCIIPLIFVGYAPLIGNNVTTMYFAVALDGNHEPLLLAFGLGTIECEESWTWFIRRLKECLGYSTEVGFISHLCYNIDLALRRVYPHSYHGYCPKDIAWKIQDFIGHNNIVEKLFLKSCSAYSVDEFYLCLETFQSACNGNTLGWLDNIPIAKWARAFFPKVRYNVESIGVPIIVNT